ncbi:MAG TPA: type II toxin-antitoxin system HicB family antitoxin [Candidatus Bathyarchaeia archaeon]|nr:type II toxin-antitoxin system HicB family antitoxin [Candidatus Bathyarchaeia archaeon]
MRLIKFEVYQDEDNFWCARGIDVDIFTQGKTLEELQENIKEAVEVHFIEELRTESIKILTLSEFEVQAVAKATSS